MQTCLRHVIDTTTRCGSRSIVRFFLVPLLYSHFRSRGDHQFSPMLSSPPRSCIVRAFPQLVSSGFQDFSLGYKDPFLSTPWLLPQSSLTSNLSLFNQFHSSQ